MISKREVLISAAGVVLCAFVFCVGQAAAQCEQESIVPQDSGEGLFAVSVADIGDGNGDGYSDYVVGAPLTAPGGLARLYSGLDGSVLHTVTGDGTDEEFGAAVGGAGDVNNDGYADFIVGAPISNSGGTLRGRAYIISGFDGSLIFDVSGGVDYDQLGYAVAGAGDVNNDGYDDVIVGAPQEYAILPRGFAEVYSGIDGSLLHRFISTTLWGQYGNSVDGGGDIDGDGFDDLIVGEPFRFNRGEVYVYSGQTGALLHSLSSGYQDGQFGQAVAGAGDADGDGYGDFVIGAPADESHGPNAGRVFIYSGLTGSVLHDLAGPPGTSYLGGSVSRAGDVNADGYDDVLIGGNRFAVVVSGSDGSILRFLQDGQIGNSFGKDVSSTGVLDPDGQLQIIVGNHREGQAHVFACSPCSCPAQGDLAPLSSSGDGIVDVLDVVAAIDHVFRSGPALPTDEPACISTRADIAPATVGVDCGDGAVEVLDVVGLIDHVFRSGPQLCNPCSP